MKNNILFGSNSVIGIEDILSLSARNACAILSTEQSWRQNIDAGALFLKELWADGAPIYGVTTGYGDSHSTIVPTELVRELPLNLTRFHGCGMGSNLSEQAARAVLAVRLASLCSGYSGVRFQLLENIAAILNSGIVPVIPQEGSVGASGDLTPLSYVAAMLAGEREVLYKGLQKPSAQALNEVGISPLVLEPKEALAIMNGTSVMTALAVLAYDSADYLIRLAARLTALSVVVLQGNSNHFMPELFAAKPHPGQVEVANWIYKDLVAGTRQRYSPTALQDRYSLRCAPQIIGVLADALPLMKQIITTEINSANDNPLIDPTTKTVMHGGHFYGGHIAFAMDTIKTQIANLADLLDRQLALLVDPRTNNGLTANLSGAPIERRAINHGLKAVHIAASAWTAEALKLSMPASVFSRSTENHNQDKVSMGTIAARDCLRIIELTQQTAAASTLAIMQGLYLREMMNELNWANLSGELGIMVTDLKQKISFINEDRPLQGELTQLVKFIQLQRWNLYVY